MLPDQPQRLENGRARTHAKPRPSRRSPFHLNITASDSQAFQLLRRPHLAYPIRTKSRNKK